MKEYPATPCVLIPAVFSPDDNTTLVPEDQAAFDYWSARAQFSICNGSYFIIILNEAA